MNKPQSINESDLSSRVAFLITGLEREKKKTNKKTLTDHMAALSHRKINK